MTYYLKYRPKKLDDLDIQNVRESLKKLVSSGNIPHAFLFTGPKGTGKTSAARILASIVNCESVSKQGIKKINPCGKCDSCLSIANGSNMDVIELDAASHRGIDDVRILRDAVVLAPVKSKKKVYIIDEAHMLTTEASNALLKTLEEPPNHVFFILATTNPEKLIETIKSRTTIINFNKATHEEIIQSLQKIVKGEKIKIDNKVVELIAKYSEGSFRDAHKIIEQLVNEKITDNFQKVEKFLFTSLPSNIDILLNLIIYKRLSDTLEEIDRLIKKGTNAEYIVQKLIEKFRQSLLAKAGIGKDNYPKIDQNELISLIELLIKANKDLKASYIEELPLEIAVIKWCQQQKKLEETEPQDIKIENKKNDSQPLKKIQQKFSKQSSRVKGDIKEISAEIWNKILMQIRPLNMSVEALLRAAKPVKFDGKILTLGVYYRFHKERLEDVRNRQILEKVIEQVLTIPAKVTCILTEPPVKKLPDKKDTKIVLSDSKEEDIVKAAKDIFGN